jgi:cytochrome P450 PksS
MTPDTSTAPSYDLWAPQVRANPFPLYKHLREKDPVARVMDPHRQMPFWLLTRYRDVVETAKDVRLTNDVEKLPEELRKKFRGGSSQTLNRHLLVMDPPDHTRVRALATQAFTPRRVEALRPRITALCAELLEAMKARGSADFVEAFAFPLPITVISELLGVPLEDRTQFRTWIEVFFTPPAQGGMERIRETLDRLLAYLEGFIELRRRQPQEDLVTALLAVEEQGDRLSTRELLSMIYLLLVAGHETTVHVLSNGTLELLRHPDQLQLLREDPSLIPSAVEELLRFCGPVELTMGRFALEDFELCGQPIKAHDVVRMNILAANRDAEQFPDPDRLDVTRSPNKHLAFGQGIHFCLGSTLARLEATLAFGVIIERLPHLRLAVPPDQLQWRSSAQVRGLMRLPLSFEAP